MLDVDVDDEVVLLVNVEGTIHAVSAWCTHQGTALALGRLEGGKITCWAHLWCFDVATGQPLYPPMARVAPGYRLRRYAVNVEGGEIYITLSN
jgi:3-phenylpropionate/trans-cinnamate dioxygenase ferredoxin subunit